MLRIINRKVFARRNVKKRDFSTELCRDFAPSAVHFLYDMSGNIRRTTNGRPYGFCTFIRQNVINLVGNDVQAFIEKHKAFYDVVKMCRNVYKED